MPQPSFPEFRGASVFVTGGGSGIGAALTEGFVEQGARVAFVGRSDASAFVAEVEGRTGTAPLWIPCDITDTPALEAAMDRAAAAHGPITILINNAANDTRYLAEEVSPQIWDEMLAVNLRAYFFACRHVAPMMRGAGGGSIVNFSSISYMLGLPALSTYIAANAGIVGLTRSLAREWGADNIRVNALAPGWVLTERQLRLWATPEALEEFLKKQCLPRHLEPRDVLGSVLFLASSLSAMMTGQNLVIDGGVVVTG